MRIFYAKSKRLASAVNARKILRCQLYAKKVHKVESVPEFISAIPVFLARAVGARNRKSETYFSPDVQMSGYRLSYSLRGERESDKKNALFILFRVSWIFPLCRQFFGVL
jgi:hypothetical protein